MAEATYEDIIKDSRRATDREYDAPSGLEPQVGAHAAWAAKYSHQIIGALVREHNRAEQAEARLRGEIPIPVKKCGARAVGGPCVLELGHNRGQLDVPSNHRTGPAHRNNRAYEIGREILEINTAIDELAMAYGAGPDRNKRLAWESDVFHALSNRREALRTELREMG